jgi:nucleoside-diphosphate-sugar epimerase
MEDRLLDAAAKAGPQLFILRPTIVYGPFSEPWTIRYARRIAALRWRTLGAAGTGTCNLVHGEDIARAVVLAASADVPGGSHVLNINGRELVSWNEYIERFGDALGISDRTTPSLGMFTVSAMALQALRTGVRWLKARGLRRPAGSPAPAIARAQSLLGLYPTRGELKLLRRQARYSAERAARVLGFQASIPLTRGLQQSAAWCRIHGVI